MRAGRQHLRSSKAQTHTPARVAYSHNFIWQRYRLANTAPPRQHHSFNFVLCQLAQDVLQVSPDEGTLSDHSAAYSHSARGKHETCGEPNSGIPQSAVDAVLPKGCFAGKQDTKQESCSFTSPSKDMVDRHGRTCSAMPLVSKWASGLGTSNRFCSKKARVASENGPHCMKAMADSPVGQLGPGFWLKKVVSRCLGGVALALAPAQPC